jgi:hypothetical protein
MYSLLVPCYIYYHQIHRLKVERKSLDESGCIGVLVEFFNRDAVIIGVSPMAKAFATIVLQNLYVLSLLVTSSTTKYRDQGHS